MTHKDNKARILDMVRFLGVELNHRRDIPGWLSKSIDLVLVRQAELTRCTITDEDVTKARRDLSDMAMSLGGFPLLVRFQEKFP